MTEVIMDDYTKVDLFNRYFVSVFTKENISSLLDPPSYCSPFSFDNIQVTPSEVSAVDANKACGPDGICARLLNKSNIHNNHGTFQKKICKTLVIHTRMSQTYHGTSQKKVYSNNFQC